MKKFVLTFILCFPLVLFAQENTSSAADKAVICSACHGQQGNSPNPDWPNIAGQHPKYFIKQLNDMKDSALRNAPTMNALVATLSKQDMDDLAAYYAKMPLANGSTPKQFLKRGEQIYRGGDFAKRITACIACHGPKGTGNAQAGFPILSGQHAAYTVLQLNAFKDGKRKNDLNHIMQDISSRMSQEDMEAVAHYIEGLH
ncbi:cytochrome c4 [Legionella qingyii]|uniref:Cytochrome c4 n=1 Tax=Legionella qingyii TaxID=2184757 RepID=A0A317U5G4_9GAMM|nr:c-type cytochrome [Legionella qingyii]PWY55712.1 cytochrome c4 [Legionella qingyii]RUR21620.1 cytochrome c4 [Legionella qingyii]RUR25112.1 cytochrome c4 [Legionella qingyii]